MLILSLLLMASAGVCIPGAAALQAPMHSGLEVTPESSQVLQVWFDATPQLTTLYPPAYIFNVAAKTAPGLFITTLFWNFGDGSTLSVPFSAQSQVSDIRAHQYASQENYCVTVTAYDSGGNVATASVSLRPNYDFTLSASPATENVNPASSASYNVTVGSAAAACGVPVNVSLSISTPQPQGVTWTLNVTSGNTPFTSTLLGQTSASTPQGTYTINIVGSSANVTHSVTVSMVVTGPYFQISVAPNSLFVPAQSEGDRINSTTLTVQSFNGFDNSVVLSASGLPNGMSYSFSDPTSPPDGVVTSILTITTSCSVAPGSYGVVIQGASGNLVSQTALAVAVAACSGFSFNLFWLILFGGVIGLLVLIPLLFLLFRRRNAAPLPVAVPVVVPPPEPPPVVVPLPKVSYCDNCGSELTLVAPFRRYCENCGKAFG